jgi:hypothetical protein
LNMPLVLLLTLLAGPPINPQSDLTRQANDFRDIAASGRSLVIDTPDARVGAPPRLAPGPPPLLSFRFYEGKQHHRFGDVDIMLDDAGH